MFLRGKVEVMPVQNHQWYHQPAVISAPQRVLTELGEVEEAKAV